MNLLKGKRADQKELAYIQRKKTKNEPDNEQDYITYSLNYEKERERKRLEYHAKKECCLKGYYC